MSYTALYRKFRPQEFEDVKGQDHIVTTLKNGRKDAVVVDGMRGVRDFTRRFANEMELLGYFEISAFDRIFFEDIVETKITYTN